MFSERDYARRTKAKEIRDEATNIANERSHPQRINNGEESAYGYLANFHKGLPHNKYGEVLHSAYHGLLTALTTGENHDFKNVSQGHDGTGRKFVNPQAGLAFDLQGADTQSMMIPPAPRIDGAENSAEMGELYWMALLRDVHFADYKVGEALVDDAVTSMNDDFTDFRGPKVNGSVTHQSLFRGTARSADGGLDDLTGPYISQFLLKGNTIRGPFNKGNGFVEKDGYVQFGTLRVDQRNTVALAGLDYLKEFNEWKHIQDGNFPTNNKDEFEPDLKFIRNLRDLATYVHFDQLYQAYFNACLYLLSETNPSTGNPTFPVSAGNPYNNSPNQAGFASFGGPHILSLVTEVSTRALKAAWHTKWYVHRRLRPEAFGGLIHVHLCQSEDFVDRTYPMINEEILRSLTEGGLSSYFKEADGYLLSMAFPEGSPMHPAYGAGHATVAGACITVLKAWFNEDTEILNPVIASPDGSCLVDYKGDDRDRMTVRSELNKLAGNISIGRNGAGVHWRTDYTESIKLGESVAISILQEQSLTYNEKRSDGSSPYFELTCFDGRTCHIEDGEVDFRVRSARSLEAAEIVVPVPRVIPDITPNLG